MAIEDFLTTYQKAMLNKKIVNPLSSRNTAISDTQFGINNQNRGSSNSPTFGSQIPGWLDSRKSNAINNYMQSKSERTSQLATDYADKAAGQVQVNEWGIPTDKMTDFSDFFNKQLGAVGDIGKSALATDEAKARWQSLQGMQELNAGYNINYTPGASGNNPGSKAVSYAMNAYNNHTPYVWGGNSLTRGVDCSGLVQQVYAKLGIKLPRTTYEQAKSGRRVSLNNLLPGDLVFYNTGKNDPNGIGTYGHVALYIGNGQIVDARNSRSGMKVGSMNIMGGPAAAVRPW